MSCNHELHPHCGCCGTELCPDDVYSGGYCGEPVPVSRALRARGVTGAACAISICATCCQDPAQPKPWPRDETQDWDPKDARCPKHGGPFKLTSFDHLDLHVQQRALTLAEANHRLLEVSDHRHLLAQFIFEEFMIDDPFIGPTNEGDVDPIAFYGLAFLRSEYCQLAEWIDPQREGGAER